MLSNFLAIHHTNIIHLTQILDGHESPLNGMIGKSLERGLYAHFILNMLVNWAGFVDV